MEKSSGSGTANDAAVDTNTDNPRPDDTTDLVERLTRKVAKAEAQLADAKAALAQAKKEA